MILAILLAVTQVFRLEVDSEATEPVGRVVGVDGVKREVRLVTPEAYDTLTGDVVRAWRKMNDTEGGRRDLHGPRKSSEFRTGERTTVYSDGYRFTEKAGEANVKRRQSAVKAAPRKDISERHRKYLEELEKRKNSSVTVIHDAVTGKDKVVE